MRVLIAYATKHGSTIDVAESLAAGIRYGLGIPASAATAGPDPDGSEVVVWTVDDAPDPGDFDAIIVGSAVYMGRWLPQARSYLRDNANAIAGVRTWLFSTGPIGWARGEDPLDLAEITEDVAPEGHVVFGGKLDRSLLDPDERAAVVALRVDDGDFRDRTIIAQWGVRLAAELRDHPEASA